MSQNRNPEPQNAVVLLAVIYAAQVLVGMSLDPRCVPGYLDIVRGLS